MTNPNLSSQQFYHVASPQARDSIATHGLDWRRGPHADVPMLSGEGEELPRANYLYRTLESARERAGSTGEDVYEVAGHGLTVHPDPYEDSEAVMTHEPVHPSRLSLW